MTKARDAMTDDTHIVTFTLVVRSGVFGGFRTMQRLLAHLRAQPGVESVSAQEEFVPETVEISHGAEVRLAPLAKAPPVLQALLKEGPCLGGCGRPPSMCWCDKVPTRGEP